MTSVWGWVLLRGIVLGVLLTENWAPRRAQEDHTPCLSLDRQVRHPSAQLGKRTRWKSVVGSGSGSVNDKLCVVQFIHPGGEHAPDDGRVKTWNTDAHRRKFLTSPGRYVAGDEVHHGDIVFWGEWEPESRVVAVIPEPLPDGPRWIYEPYYTLPASYRSL